MQLLPPGTIIAFFHALINPVLKFYIDWNSVSFSAVSFILTGVNDSVSTSLSADGSRHVTDDVINACTHLAGAVFALLGSVMLIVKASMAAKPWHIVGFSIYGISLVFLLIASTLHHGVKLSPRNNYVFRVMDYSGIFLLIAGTMTPICMTILRSPIGWSVLSTAWVVAIIGITLKGAIPTLPKWVTNTLTLAMGWLPIVLAIPLFQATGLIGLSWVVGGGLLYTIGAVLFAIEKPNPVPGRFGFHEIWHLFVLGGMVLHFIFLYQYVLPSP